MTTLLIAELTDREFGTSVLKTSDFANWLDSKGLSIQTLPPFSNFEFLHIETLLVCIERGATEGLTREEATDIVQNIPRMTGDRAAKHSSKWLIGAEAHQQWRQRIAQATLKGELVILDLSSKLPIETEKDSRPLSDKERTTLLVIIAALAKEAKISLDQPSKAAETIAKITQDMGSPVSKRAIEGKLNLIADALADRANT